MVKTTGTDLTKRRVCGSRILFRQTVAAVFVLELLGNRQRAEPELLVNKTAVGETETEPATHPHREKERSYMDTMESLPSTMFEEFSL